MVVSAVKLGKMSPKSSVMSVVLSLCLDDPYWDPARKFSDKITKLANNLHYEQNFDFGGRDETDNIYQLRAAVASTCRT